MIDFCVERAFYRNNGAEVNVLSDVEIKVGAGACLVIIGPSGCGKSTLLKIIAGLHKEYDGRGTRPDRIGYMPQAFGLLPWKTVLQNIVSLKDALDGSYDKSLAYELLSSLGMDGFADRYPRTLSGGQMQRAALARALFLEPRLLLMDEPFSALDEITREGMQGVFSEIQKKQGITAVCITHSIEEALLLGDEIIAISGVPGTVIHRHKNNLRDGASAGVRNDDFYAGVKALRGVIRFE